MAGKTATLAIKIIGDAKDAITAIEATDASLNGLSSSSMKTAGAVAAVTTALGACAKSAGLLEEATGAVNAIFGEFAPQMMEWAESMNQYGVSTAQAAAASAILGGSLQAAGIPLEQTVVATQRLVEISADMVAIYGGTMPQALAAMGAALRGEYDSLERFGIFLTADKVAAESMRLAQEGLTFASEEQAKAVATLSLIWQGAQPVLGAAEEESDNLFAAMGRLRAGVIEATAAVGDGLIPVLVPLIDLITRCFQVVETLFGNFEILNNIMLALQPVIDALNSLLDALAPLIETVGSFIATILNPPLQVLEGLINAAASALETIIGIIETAVTWFNNLASAVLECVDALTFWNDTYESTPAPPTGMSVAANAFTRGAGAYAMGGAPTVNITLQVGVGDPHAIAREIRRVLAKDSQRLGRVAAA